MAGTGLKLGVVVVIGVLVVGGLFVLTLGSVLLDTPGQEGEELDTESPPSSENDVDVNLSRDPGPSDSGNVSEDGSGGGEEAGVTREELLATYRESLETGGVSVVSLGVEDGMLWLNYSSSRTNESVVRQEIGVVSGYYASLVERGLNVSRLEARILDRENESVARYRVETSWARGFLEDRLSRDEYASKIFDSLETSD